MVASAANGAREEPPPKKRRGVRSGKVRPSGARPNTRSETAPEAKKRDGVRMQPARRLEDQSRPARRPDHNTVGSRSRSGQGILKTVTRTVTKVTAMVTAIGAALTVGHEVVQEVIRLFHG